LPFEPFRHSGIVAGRPASGLSGHANFADIRRN
jgi:hypothetical protein